MTINDLPGMLLQTVQDHIPTGAAWVPLAVLAGIAGAGLILMTRGARLAPGLTAVAIAFGGGALGAMLVPLVNTPFWPTVAIASTLGLVFGIVLFRLWLAILVAGCLVVASLGVYANQTLRDPLNTYLSRGLDVQNQEITLRPAGEVVAARSTAQTELAGLWDYLSDTVPAFKSSVFVILTAAAVAGLIFALLLPGFARACWAATFGTGLLLLAACGAVQTQWPAGGAWLNRWGLIAAGVLWGVSMLFNLADLHGVRLKKTAAAAKKPAAA